MKVLIVDDALAIRIIQKRILEELGHEVSEAADGFEGLRVIEENRPDVVLIDWNMPNMDGLELIRQIRQHDMDLPLIMVTTEVERHRIKQAIQAGVNAYVTKPFTPEVIAEKLTQVVSVVET